MLMDELRPKSAPSQAAAGKKNSSTGASADLPVEDFTIDLPEELGSVTRARVTGSADLPLVIVLGGISGNRFVCGRPDGTRGWWSGLVGRGEAIDPAQWRVLGLDFAADETGKRA